ncbi:uncharacterized protein LOC115157178 isoform X1 [Salmo trutta]|uniref:uncharacterized protein LOC115157178 isoform X1 n=1 Tax=Salmo trutta TaxID=8032 RepID=UPI0011305BEC|nr:uncharacterized protein LOC115157178 isoform X1 [Salmo trutta]
MEITYADPENKKLAEVIKALDNYCAPRRNTVLERHPFWAHNFNEQAGHCYTSINSAHVDQTIRPGHSFSLACEFVCLQPSHVMQWWKDGQVLLNASSILPNITLSMHVSGAGEKDSGNYSCRTEPPDALGTTAVITVEDLPTSGPSVNTLEPTVEPKQGMCEVHGVGVYRQGVLDVVMVWYLLLKAIFLILMVTTIALVLACRLR